MTTQTLNGAPAINRDAVTAQHQSRATTDILPVTPDKLEGHDWVNVATTAVVELAAAGLPFTVDHVHQVAPNCPAQNLPGAVMGRLALLGVITSVGTIRHRLRDGQTQRVQVWRGGGANG